MQAVPCGAGAVQGRCRAGPGPCGAGAVRGRCRAGPVPALGRCDSSKCTGLTESEALPPALVHSRTRLHSCTPALASLALFRVQAQVLVTVT